jgi:hypothetical protein
MRIKDFFYSDFFEWLLVWGATSVFGMMWVSGNWMKVLDREIGGGYPSGKSAGSVIRITERDGSVSEVRTTGNVSSHQVTSAPGTTVEIRNLTYGTGFTGKGAIIFVLVALTLWMCVEVFGESLYPTMYQRNMYGYSAEPRLFTQIGLIVLVAAYFLNLISLFIYRYKVNKVAGKSPVMNFTFIGLFLGITLLYIVWFTGKLADSPLNIYFPLSYFNPS